MEQRAKGLLPEETAAGSDNALAQAEAILAESDQREFLPNAAPDTVLERRTSAETAATGDDTPGAGSGHGGC